MSVQILTDSTSYLSEEVKKELDIRVISLNISFKDEESIREVDFDNETFYKVMSNKGVPVSSQPSIGHLVNEMVSVVEKGDALCGIFLSSELSGTFSAAQMASEMVKEKYPNAEIEIIDSRSTATQQGFAVIQAARAAKEGKSLEQVKEVVLKNMKKSRFLFLPHNLDYLKKGGRIGGASALLGNLFKIIPILTVVEGKVAVLSKVRTKEKAVRTMVEKLVSDVGEYGIGEVVVLHINCINEAKELANHINQKLAVHPNIMNIGPVVGMHVGPGAIGIVYYTEKELKIKTLI